MATPHNINVFEGQKYVPEDQSAEIWRIGIEYAETKRPWANYYVEMLDKKQGNREHWEQKSYSSATTPTY
jgi:hypothetical protein